MHIKLRHALLQPSLISLVPTAYQPPQHAAHAGATRNYEPWRDKDKDKEEAAAKRAAEEAGNAMKALENRTADSKREMDIMNALDDMRSLKALHAKVSQWPGQLRCTVLERHLHQLVEGSWGAAGGISRQRKSVMERCCQPCH